MCHALLFLREEGRDVSARIAFSTRPVSLEAFDHLHEVKIGPRDWSNRDIIKKLALLSSEPWLPIVELTETGNVKSAFLASVDAERSHDFLVIEQQATGVVRLGLGESMLTLLATPPREGEKDTNDPIASFISAVMNDATHHPPHRSRAKRLLRSALSRSHGALLAVVDAEKVTSALDASCNSYVRLSPPIALSGGESNASDAKLTDDVTAQLAAMFDRLMQVDGVVVFGSNFTIQAYGAFIRVNASSADGGARALAFKALQTEHAEVFRAALFRSQDGEPLYRKLADPAPSVRWAPRI